MADEITQPRTVGGVLPSNATRDRGKRPEPPPARRRPERRKPSDRQADDPPHRVDEYV